MVALPSVGLCYLYGILYRRAALVQHISSLVVQNDRTQIRGIAATPHGESFFYGPNLGTVFQRWVLAHRRRVYRYYRQRDRRAVLVKTESTLKELLHSAL